VRSALALPESKLWTGTLEGGEGRVILALLSAEHNVLWLRDGAGIRPLPGPAAKSEPHPTPALRCATSEAEVTVAPAEAPPDQPAEHCPRQLPLAIELDSAAIERFGGRRDEAIAQIELRLALAFEEVTRATGLTVAIERFICLESPPRVGSVGASELYAETWSRWSDRPAAERPTAILHVTGLPLEQEAFGLAWIGGVAGGPAQRCVVARAEGSDATALDAAILLHLLAHLLGADHCAAAPENPCALMAERWPIAESAPTLRLEELAAKQIAALTQRLAGRQGVEASDQAGDQRPESRPLLPLPHLAAPSALAASEGTRCEGIELRWEQVAGAASYEVQRRLDAQDSPWEVATSVPSPPWVDGAATPGARFRYRVVALDPCRRSGPSEEASGFTPLPVGGARDVAAGDGTRCGETAVTWHDVEHAAAYEVLRNSVNNPATAIVIGRSDEAFFVDGAPPQGLAWYWVRAMDGCGRAGPLSRGDSGFSGGAPPAPAGVAATDGAACDSVILAWNPVAGATAYDIVRSTTPDFATAVHLAQVPATPFEDGATVPGVSLFYWVRAVGPCGKGPFAGPGKGRAAGNLPRIVPPAPAAVPCGGAWQSAAPILGNAECAVPVTWSLLTGPPGLILTADGSARWEDPLPGTWDVTIAARNDSGVGQAAWSLHVPPALPALLLPAGPLRGEHGVPWSDRVPEVGNPRCAGAVRWAVVQAPEGVRLDSDGALHWPAPEAGEHRLQLRASNEAGAADGSLLLLIAPPPAPLLAAPDEVRLECGTPVAGVTIPVSNIDRCGPLTWSLIDAPSGMTIDGQGRVHWPSPSVGRHGVVAKAAGSGGDASTTVRLEIRPTPPLPHTPTAARIKAGSLWTITLSLDNASCAGAVTWKVLAGPPGLTVDESGGVLWSDATVGSHTVRVAAANSAGEAVVEWLIEVEEVPPPEESPSTARGTKRR
jgi:hypothetical protein